MSAVSAGPAATAPSVKRGAPVSARVAPAATGVAAAVTKAVVTSGGASGVPAASVVTAAPPQSGPRFRLIDLPASAAPRKSGPPAEDLLGKVLGTQVTFINRTGRIIAVAQVPDGGRNDAEAQTVFLRPGEAGFYSGDNSGSGNMDVRLRVYDVVIDPDTGDLQRGVMSQIITATNRWVGPPATQVLMDPCLDSNSISAGCDAGTSIFGSERKNRCLSAGGGRVPCFTPFEVGRSFNADYRLQGPYQQGVTATYMERKSDSDDHKIFLIEAYSLPGLGTQDYPIGDAVVPNV